MKNLTIDETKFSENGSLLNLPTNQFTPKKTFSEQVLSTDYNLRFPSHALPDELKQYCQLVADCLCIPIEFTAAPALFACSVATGGIVKFKNGPYPNLPIFWNLVLADTGKQKSYPMKLMLTPLFDRDKESEKKYRTLILEQDEQKSKQPPRRQKYVLSDVTSEAIDRQHLWNNGGGVGIYSDEITKYLGNLGKYNGTKDAEYARKMERYSNAPINVDRIGNSLGNVSYTVHDSPENILGGHQPTRLNMIINKDSILSGDFARYNIFLPPDYEKQGKAEEIPIGDQKKYDSLINALFMCTPQELYDDTLKRKEHTYRISGEALINYNCFKSELDDIHNKAGLGSYLRGIEGKSAEKASRYALLFQAIEDAYKDENSEEITNENMFRAIEITKYHFFTSMEVIKMLKQSTVQLSKSELLRQLVTAYPKTNKSKLTDALGIDRVNFYKMLK